MRHGPPKEIISDQGPEFLNQTVKELCQRMNTIYSTTSNYLPRSNGTAERFNQTFLAKFTPLMNRDFENWSS